MHLVLALPGLLAQTADRNLGMPCLARLTASAGAPAREPDGPDAMLAALRHRAFGERRLSAAAVRLAAVGVDLNRLPLAADPVTLVAGRDDKA
jgi:hypothetical protein